MLIKMEFRTFSLKFGASENKSFLLCCIRFVTAELLQH